MLKSNRFRDIVRDNSSIKYSIASIGAPDQMLELMFLHSDLVNLFELTYFNEFEHSFSKVQLKNLFIAQSRNCRSERYNRVLQI